jgi:uncharacterized repeat protein (TIGR01451 family)
MKQFRTISLFALFGLVLMVITAGSALAAGTDAGATISNQASLDYEVGGINQPDILSDGDGNLANGPETTDFVVDNRVDLTMAGGDNLTASGTGQIITFQITNTGNETQGYSLELFTGNNGSDGDTVDMTNVAVYLDNNNDGVVDGGDTLYAPGSGNNIADIPANSGAASTIQILVASDVPAGALTGDTASYTIKATTLDTGTTTVTTATAGADDPTVIDVVLADADAGAGVNGSTDGATNGQFLATATYTVQAAQLSITKAVAVVSDPFNGAANPKAIPGATVRYTIVITNSGAAAADSVEMTDPIPTNTDFLVGTVTESTGTGATSYDDGAATFTYGPVAGANGEDAAVTDIRITIPTIAGSGGSATITFDVLIE